MTGTYIIAEAGVNHNGNADLAFELIDKAASAGVDAVKFQTFKAENIVTKTADKADYQKKTTDRSESQFDMLKNLELSYDTYQELVTYCRGKNVDFLSTAFDSESLDFLINVCNLDVLKIPSGEITNGPLLLSYAQSGCDLIVSTGMATLAEIEEALSIIAFGMVHRTSCPQPSNKQFQQAYMSQYGQKLLQEKVTLLHCTTEYPAPLEDINLNAMLTLRDAFGLNIGYSDHSEGIGVPISAVTLGATLIEKHFTLDKTLSGPDHKASLEPDELKEMVAMIRNAELIMGTRLKGPMDSEFKNKSIARKSIVAKVEIEIGDIFTADNLAIKRPGTGLSPMRYWDILGTVSQRNYRQDEIIL